MTKDELAAFIAEARAAGANDDQVRSFVEQKMRQITPPQPVAEPSTPQLPRGVYGPTERDLQKLMLQGTGMAVGTIAGGGLGVTTAGQLAGEIGGAYLGGRLTGMTPKEAGTASLIGGAAGLAGRGISYGATRLAGKMAGLNPETVRAGIRDSSLLKPAKPDAELQLARELEANTEIQAAKTTPYHADYQKMLASRANERVSADPVLEAFTKNITGGDHPTLRAADRQVEAMGGRLVKRIGPDGKISLAELDAYIRENFTKPLNVAYSRESEAETARRLMSIREELTDYLYRNVSPEAAPAQAFTQRALRKREAVEGTFSLGTAAKPSGAGAEAIRGIRANTGRAQQNRATLAAYDAEYGTDFLGKAERLSMQKEWSGDQLSEAYAIDSVLQPQRPSFVRGTARPVARAGARFTKYAGPTSAAAAAAFYNAMNNP